MLPFISISLSAIGKYQSYNKLYLADDSNRIQNVNQISDRRDILSKISNEQHRIIRYLVQGIKRMAWRNNIVNEHRNTTSIFTKTKDARHIFHNSSSFN